MFGKGVDRSKESRRQMVCPNPSCGKELPKCGVCLLPLEFQGARKESDQREKEPAPAGTQPTFTMWFSWCQKCTHGGHTKCYGPWFEKHNICPVPGCDCQCGALDSALRAAASGVGGAARTCVPV